MTYCNTFYRAWKLPEWLGLGDGFQDGFFAGTALFLVLFLVLLLVKLVLARKRSTSGISVAGGKGELFITTAAVKEFVGRLLIEFEAVHLRSLKLAAKGKKVALNLEIGVNTKTGLPPLRDAIQERVITAMQEKLGLNVPPRVNLKIRSFKLEPSEAESQEGPVEAGDDLPDLELKSED